jgi:hypothetical protein
MKRIEKNDLIRPWKKLHCLSLGAKNEHFVLNAIWNIHLFNTNVKVEGGPIEFCLVHCVDYNGLATLIDRFLDIMVDGRVFPCALDIKSMSNPSTLKCIYYLLYLIFYSVILDKGE